MDYLHTQNQTYDCIIIGGGISGISFAHKLSRLGKTILILEKDRQAGGQIQTYTTATYPDFWVEMGAHTCYNSYTHLLSMLFEAGLKDEIRSVDKCSYMLSTEKGIKSMFSQISCLSLMLRGMKIFFSSKTGKSVKEYFRPILGKKNYDKLFSKMFRAVICQQADDYPAQFFLKKRKDRFNEMPRKFSFNGGLASMINAIITQDKLSVLTSTEVTGITYKEKTYQIQTSGGQLYEARNIALATNPQVSAQILKDLAPDISRLFKTIPLSYSDTLNVIIEKEKLDLKPVAGIISTSDEFMSAVSRDVIKHPQLRSFSFHFIKDGKNKDEQLALVCRVLNIQKKDIVSHAFTTHILPSPHKEHTSIANQIEAIRKNDRIFFLGNYYYGLSLEDCVHRSNDEFERYKRIFNKGK